MMQFYKKRDFGAFISDSFTFFKLYGKNYFKNYILLNGLLLILMVVVFIFGYRELFMQIFGSNMSGESYYFESYFEDNIGMFIVVGLLTFLLFTIMMIVNYLFPVFYLKRLAEGEMKIKTDDILGDFKKNAGKIGKLCTGNDFRSHAYLIDYNGNFLCFDIDYYWLLYYVVGLSCIIECCHIFNVRLF
ncbi:hypothetical protein [Chryseobacterium indoltheticum]|uniref:hypothetical protein n=1 Tax=Chryseobacterium indoltheticum TaxID=254 RepID=UPI003F490E5D